MSLSRLHLVVIAALALIAAGVFGWRQRSQSAVASSQIVAAGPICRRPMTTGYACVGVQQSTKPGEHADFVVGAARSAATHDGDGHQARRTR
jgi:hypothetical protein